MKALILDMDGVIIDSEPGNLEAVLEYVRSFRPQAGWSDLRQIAGRTKKDVWTRIAAAAGTGWGWEETQVDYEKRWKPAHLRQVDYRSLFREDTIDVLKEARRRGMKTAVASSTAYGKVTRILAEVGVTPLLDRIVSGEDFEESKPHPAIYLKTAQLLGVEPEECVAVEDSTVGITAAHRAGVRVIALVDERFGFDRSLADSEILKIGQIWGAVAATDGKEK